jgi:hypothetical protein
MFHQVTIYNSKGSATGIGRGLQVTIYNSKGSTTGIGRGLQVTIYNFKRLRILKGQSKMDNPEKHAT